MSAEPASGVGLYNPKDNKLLSFYSQRKKFLSGEIEIAPIAIMRGRTLNDAFIILDEAQNTTPVQMKMFLTRLGKNSKMVIAGDITQIDLIEKNESGLINAQKKWADGIIRMGELSSDRISLEEYTRTFLDEMYDFESNYNTRFPF